MEKEIEIWIIQAQRDLKSAKNSFKSKDYYISAFLSHQVVEKLLKAVYIQKFQKIWKIHDLVILAKEINAPLTIIEKCAVLNPVYFEVRYPESEELPAKKINKIEADEMLAIAGDILKWVEMMI